MDPLLLINKVHYLSQDHCTLPGPSPLWYVFLPGVFCEKYVDVRPGDLHRPQRLHQLLQKLDEKVLDFLVVRQSVGDSDDPSRQAFEAALELLAGFGSAELAVAAGGGGRVDHLESGANHVPVLLVAILQRL